MLKTYDDAIAKVQRHLAEVYQHQRQDSDHTDFSNQTELVEDSLDDLKSRRHNAASGYSNADGEVRRAKDEKAKQDREDAKRTASEAREAQKKAAEGQMKGFEGQLADKENDGDVSLAQKREFWLKIAAAPNVYPENLAKIKEKTGQLYQELGKQIEEMLRKYDESRVKAASVTQRWDEEAKKLSESQDAIQARSAAAMAKVSEVNEHNAAALRELMTAHGMVEGSITREDAARQRAAEHAADYAGQLARIEADRQKDIDLATARGDGHMLPHEGEAINKEYDAKRDEVSGAAQRTAQMDAWETQQATTWAQATASVRDFTNANTQYARMVSSLVASSIESANGAIVRQLTERHSRGQHIFGNAGADIAKSVSGSALKGAEGLGAKALGLDKLGLGGGKKPTGAAGDPLHTVMENMPKPPAIPGGGESGGGIGGWLGKLFGGGKKSGGGSGGGDDDGFDWSSIVGFASGTNFAPGGMAWVGEQGPELVNLPRGSSVTPNHRVADMGGGDVHLHIDARGSTDPAQVNAQIHAAMGAYLPHIVKASQGYAADQKRRSVGK